MIYKINTVYKMTVPSPHIKHKRLKRKQEIQTRAMQMISAEGIEALTMQKLAAGLGLTAGALYRYFRSKAELISGLESQLLRDMSKGLSLQLQKPSLPKDSRDAALLRLWICARFYLQQSSDHPEHAGLLAMLLADPRHLVADEDLPGVSADFIGLFGQLVNQLLAAEQCGALSPGDAQRRALVFWSSLQGVCSLRKLRRVDPNFFDPARAGSELVISLLIGWGAEPERAKEQERRCEADRTTRRDLLPEELTT